MAYRKECRTAKKKIRLEDENEKNFEFIIGVGITYVMAAIANAIVSSSGVVSRIAILPISYAIIIVLISTLLTSISGLLTASISFSFKASS